MGEGLEGLTTSAPPPPKKIHHTLRVCIACSSGTSMSGNIKIWVKVLKPGNYF